MKALELNPKCQSKGFWFNRSTLLSAFQSGALFMQKVIETDDLFSAREVRGASKGLRKKKSA
jgi:hypothetical protein